MYAYRPLVSVIVPAYNCKDYIDSCIESILAQTYDNIEIVVCDDASTDGTREHLGKLEGNPKIKVLYNEKNMHQAATRNRCIASSSGECILVQDADDLCAPDRVEKLLSALEPDLDFVGSGCWLFDDKATYSEMKPGTTCPQKKDLLWGISFVHASILFRKACLDAVGGYRICDYTTRGEDYDLILRLYAAGFRGKNIPDLLYGYRLDRATLARRTFRARLDEIRIRWHGFRINGILFPVGWLFALKPIPAHFYQILRTKNKRKR